MINSIAKILPQKTIVMLFNPLKNNYNKIYIFMKNDAPSFYNPNRLNFQVNELEVHLRL